MPVIEQFIPARTHILSQGLLVGPHYFERAKAPQRDYGVEIASPSGYSFSSRVVKTLSAGPDATATDGDVIAYNESNTSTFQSKLYDRVEASIDVNVPVAELRDLTRNSTQSVPLYVPTRVARFLPIDVFPFEPEKTVLDIEMDNVVLSPSAFFDATITGFRTIKGTTRIRKRGKSLKVFRPALRFEFPTTSNLEGVVTNLLVARVGDRSLGEEVDLRGTDVLYEPTLDRGKIDFTLTLGGAAASAITGSDRGLIVPLRIVNLLSRVTNVYNLALSDNADDRAKVSFEPQILEPESNL